MNYRIFPPEEILETTIARLPLSKSISARALVLNALTPGGRVPDKSRLADCNDTHVIAEALKIRQGNVDIADCGTAARFLTAFFAATEGVDVIISGTERMNQRPVGSLVDALCQLGAQIEYCGTEGCLPLHICGCRLNGGEVSLNASASSQFASALAMIGPTMREPLRINLGGEIASMPYLTMTLRMLENRGVRAEIAGYTVEVDATPCRDIKIECEPDWSAAGYWYAIAAVTAGWVTIPGLKRNSLQGDKILAEIGERFGVLTEFTDKGAELSATPDLYSRLDLDLSDNPDLAPMLAVVGCMVNMPYIFTGVANLRHKESDRINAIMEELFRCGWVLRSDGNTLEWEGTIVPVGEMPVFSSRGDHRMAMALAVISQWIPGIVIRNAEAVAKSYPGFWDDLRDAGFILQEV